MNDPIGRDGSSSPARARRTAFDTASSASRWPTTRSARRSSIVSSFACSPSSIFVTGTPVHFETISAISSLVTSSESMLPSAWWRSASSFCFLREALFELDEAAVAKLGGPLEIPGALGALVVRGERLALLLRLANGRDERLLGLPLRLHSVGGFAQVGDLPFDGGEPLAGSLVGLLLQGLALDLELGALALELIELLGHRIDLDADTRVAASSTRSIALSGRKRSVM